MRAREPRQLRQCNILEYHNISPIKLQISASAIKKALDHLSRTPWTSSRKMQDYVCLAASKTLARKRIQRPGVGVLGGELVRVADDRSLAVGGAHRCLAHLAFFEDPFPSAFTDKWIEYHRIP